MSILFNQTCINEEMLPKCTHAHTHTHIYIYIYIYIYTYIYIYIERERERREEGEEEERNRGRSRRISEDVRVSKTEIIDMNKLILTCLNITRWI